MTEHRCTDGTWQEGKVKHCPKCQATRPPRTVKKSAES